MHNFLFFFEFSNTADFDAFARNFQDQHNGQKIVYSRLVTPTECETNEDKKKKSN